MDRLEGKLQLAQIYKEILRAYWRRLQVNDPEIRRRLYIWEPGVLQVAIPWPKQKSAGKKQYMIDVDIADNAATTVFNDAIRHLIEESPVIHAVFFALKAREKMENMKAGAKTQFVHFTAHQQMFLVYLMALYQLPAFDEWWVDGEIKLKAWSELHFWRFSFLKQKSAKQTFADYRSEFYFEENNGEPRVFDSKKLLYRAEKHLRGYSRYVADRLYEQNVYSPLFREMQVCARVCQFFVQPVKSLRTRERFVKTTLWERRYDNVCESYKENTFAMIVIDPRDAAKSSTVDGRSRSRALQKSNGGASQRHHHVFASAAYSRRELNGRKKHAALPPRSLYKNLAINYIA